MCGNGGLVNVPAHRAGWRAFKVSGLALERGVCNKKQDQIHLTPVLAGAGG